MSRGRPKKEGKTFTCKLPTALLNALSEYSSITGVTKTAALEQALTTYLHPYMCDEGYPKDGVLKEKDLYDPYKTIKRGCRILGETTIYGEPYYRIAIDGKILKAPKSYVITDDEEEGEEV